ncbi:MAG: hypothetical protein IAE83_13135 [Anaerolinea sp.]|nr:hypothetical protein [Anaerolinea sp.]MCC6975350.1 hypothetical protein [Anaerolineae bacterium]
MARFLKLLILMVIVLSLPIGWKGIPAAAEGDPSPPQEVEIPGVVEKNLGGNMTTSIQGTFFGLAPNGKSPAVLMLPEMRDMTAAGETVASRTTLEAMAKQFQMKGINALTIDLSGYHWGTQKPSLLDGLADVEAAYQWLQMQPGVNPMQVGVLGSSIGANYALLLAEKYPEITSVVALSPAPDYGGLMPNPDLLKDRNVRVYAGQNELGDAEYKKWLERYPNFSAPANGHGVTMFRDTSVLESEMSVWTMDYTPADGTASLRELEDMGRSFSVCCSLPGVMMLPLIVGGSRLRFRRGRHWPA